MKSEYLLFNIIIGVFSTGSVLLYPKKVLPQLIPAVISILSVAAIFIVIDYLVTGWFWIFNPRYILGIFIANLPIEEILFFITIPWACLLLWVNVKNKITGSCNLTKGKLYILIILLIIGIFSIFTNRWYTVSILIPSLFIILLTTWKNVQRSILLMLIIIILLIFCCNGYLTFRPIVIYNPFVMLNIRIITIPIEDFLYGILLVFGVISLYEKITLRKE